MNYFNTGCENIQKTSIRLDDDMASFLMSQIEEIKHQLPAMLQNFHKLMAERISPREAEGNCSSSRHSSRA